VPIVTGGKILVIDDEPMVRSAVNRVLSDEGYSIQLASDGAAALELLRTDPPDAILLDLMMPGMNGRQFLHALRHELNATIPVVVMTAVHGLGQRAISLGATDVVEKPFDVDELLNKMALAVFRSRQTIAESTPPPLGDSPDPDEVAGVVVVVDGDLDNLRRLESRLTNHGYVVIAAPTVPEDPARLFRALVPVAIVVSTEATADAGAALTAVVRAAPSLDEVPLIMFTRRSTTTPTAIATGAAVLLTCPSDDDLLRVVQLMSSRPIARSASPNNRRSPW
jgi:DNA-binding response OmpR family regulator